MQTLKNCAEIETFSALYDDEKDVVILYDGITHGFYSLNYTTGMLHALQFLYGEKDQWGHFGNPVKASRERYIFPPCNRKNMVILDGENIEEFPIEYAFGKTWRFLNAAVCHKNIYLICGTADGVVSVNLDNREQKIIDGWMDEYQSRISQCIKDKQLYNKISNGRYIQNEDRLIFPLLWTPAVLEMDYNTKKCVIRDVVVESPNGFKAVYEVGGSRFYLGFDNQTVFEVDDKKRNFAYKCDLLQDDFGWSLLIKDKIIILGKTTYRLMVFDTITKKFTLVSFEERKDIDANMSVMFQISDTYVMFFDISTRKFFAAITNDEWKTIHIERLSLFWDEETREKLLINDLRRENIVWEDGKYKLEHLMKVI